MVLPRTVEINNTDAEGRLVLSDGVSMSFILTFYVIYIDAQFPVSDAVQW